MSLPRITVVTPTFERVEFLRECIESVLSQDYPNLEYIVCDGGSRNPEVAALIREYEGRLAWWDSQPDRGHAEAIRRGFDRSTGDIMAYLCSDDTYLPGTLRAVADTYLAVKADVVYGDTLILDDNGAVVREMKSVPASTLALITCCNIAQPSMFWTRDIYERAGAQFGGSAFEYAVFEPQVDLMYRFAALNAEWRQIRRALSGLRQHSGTVSNRYRSEITRVQREVLAKIFPYWSPPTRYKLLFKAMRARQLYWHLRQRDFSYLRRRWLEARRRKHAQPC